MKKILSVLFIGSSILTAHAQESSREPYLVKELSADAIEQVKAATNGGNISVTGAATQPRIEVYVWAGNGRERNLSKEEIKKRLESDYDLTVSAENHHLTAIAKAKPGFKNWNHGLSISFKIFVPQNSSTDLSTSGGNISLASLSGTQDFTTSGGNLELEHLSGHIKGRTSGGNINLKDLKDDIDLSTSGGNINARNSNGTMKLSTSGGSLELHTLNGAIRATTSGGNVDANAISGELYAHTSGGNVDLADLACSLDASTSGGDIDVHITTLGKYVRLTNSGGNTSLEVPQDKGIDLKLYADKVSASGLNGFKGDIKKDHIDGTLHGGGVPVSVQGGSHINFSQK